MTGEAGAAGAAGAARAARAARAVGTVGVELYSQGTRKALDHLFLFPGRRRLLASACNLLSRDGVVLTCLLRLGFSSITG